MEELTDPIETVKMLEPETTEFTANGKQYFINMDLERLTVARYERYEQFNIELGFALSFDGLYKAISNAATLVFNGDGENAYVELTNVKRGIARIAEQRTPIALYLCTLFVNRAGEDLGTWDVETADSKINDWKAENIGVGFFLGLALGMVENYKTVFNSTLAEYAQLSQLSQTLLNEMEADT